MTNKNTLQILKQYDVVHENPNAVDPIPHGYLMIVTGISTAATPHKINGPITITIFIIRVDFNLSR